MNRDRDSAIVMLVGMLLLAVGLWAGIGIAWATAVVGAILILDAMSGIWFSSRPQEPAERPGPRRRGKDSDS